MTQMSKERPQIALFAEKYFKKININVLIMCKMFKDPKLNK